MIYAISSFVSLMQTPHPPKVELLAMGGGGGCANYIIASTPPQ